MKFRPPRGQPPVKDLDTGRVSASPARTTVLRWISRLPPHLRHARHRCSTARCKGSPAPTNRRSASRATPKLRPARTTSPTCSTASWPDGGLEPHRPPCRKRKTSRASSSSAPARSSSARPVSSTTPAPRPARRCAKRATKSSWSQQPGHHHDRPGHGGRHLHRAHHLAGGREDHRQGAPRTPILPTMGGQTALNCALDLHRNGVLAKVRRRDDRCQRTRSRRPKTACKFKDAMTHRPGTRPSRASRVARWKPGRVQRRIQAETGLAFRW